MFELQSHHYYDRFSQFFTYSGRSKPKDMLKKLKKFISCDVMLKYIYTS